MHNVIDHLSDGFEFATIVSCIALGPDTSFHTAFISVEFSRFPHSSNTDWEMVTARPLSLAKSGWKIGIWRLRMSAKAALHLLTIDEDSGTLVHPVGVGLCNSKVVRVHGVWRHPVLLADGDKTTLHALTPYSPGSRHSMERFAGHECSLRKHLGEDGVHACIERIREFTKLDLASIPAHFGSIVVCWPEERIESSFLASRDFQRIGVWLRLRCGLQPTDLQVVVEGKHLDAIVASRLVRPNQLMFVVDLGTPVQHVAVRIYDRDGRLLHVEHGTLLRSVKLDMLVASSHRHTVYTHCGSIVSEVKAAGGTIVATEVGGTRPAWEDEALREQQRARVQRLQDERALFFFSGGPQERARALGELRTLISAARREVVLWDPYLDGTDVLELFGGITFDQVQVRGISAGRHIPDSGGSRISLEDAREALARTGFQFEFRQATQLHDRFLMVDGRWWQIGHSFNRVGHDIGSIYEFPSPEHLNQAFGELWGES